MLKFSGPLLVVEDIPTSRYFYEQLLGLSVAMDFGVNVSYEGNLAIHEKAHYQSLLGDAQKYPITARTHNAEMYFETEELEPLIERLEQANVEFLHKIVEQPWRQRVMRFYDPDGHILEVGETMPHLVMRLLGEGLSIEEISNATGLPTAFVEQLLKPA